MSTVLDDVLADVPADELRLFDLCDEVSGRIAAALDARGWTQRQLADALGKRESYVSRVLAGGVNLTLKTIAQFEVALGVSLIRTDTSAPLNEDVAPFYGPTVLDAPDVLVRIEIPMVSRPPDRRRPVRSTTGAEGRLLRLGPVPASVDARALAA